jgi:hypothetical protein
MSPISLFFFVELTSLASFFKIYIDIYHIMLDMENVKGITNFTT